jgi:hypothetical protein
LLDQVRERIRVKHYSIRTETQYFQWVSRPLKNFQSNTPHPLISTLVAAQKGLRGNFGRLPGPFSVHLAHFGRTYPRTHA